jgi:hypothetical protein
VVLFPLDFAIISLSCSLNESPVCAEIFLGDLVADLAEGDALLVFSKTSFSELLSDSSGVPLALSLEISVTANSPTSFSNKPELLRFCSSI